MKQIKPKQSLPTPPTNPSTLRAEIDACVHHIGELIAKDPRKVAVIFESWLNQPKRQPQKKKAA
jgi:hypothetical protein